MSHSSIEDEISSDVSPNEVEIINMDDEETQDVEATTSPHPSSAAPPTTTATPSTFGANLSEHSAFSGVSFYSVSVNSEQSEITAPQTNVTSLSRNVGTPSRISIDARSADDFNVVDSSVRESEKSLEVILEHGQRLPMREGDKIYLWNRLLSTHHPNFRGTPIPASHRSLTIRTFPKLPVVRLEIIVK